MIVNSEVKADDPKSQENIESTVSQVKQDNNQVPEITKTEDDGIDPNWKAFREARKKDRAEKEAAERRAAEKEAEAAALKAAMEAAFARQNNQPVQSYHEQYDQEESEDVRIEKKVNALLAQREAEAERQRQIREHQEYPQRLQQNYPDIGQVTNPENLDYLQFHYPEVAEALMALPDGYDKWVKVYKNIKKFVPNHTNSRREAQKAENNLNRPKSISSPNIAQPGEIGSSARITEEKRAANWERMQKLLKSVG